MPTKPVQLQLPDRIKPATLFYLAHTTGAEPVAFDLQFLHRLRDPKWINQFPDWATSHDAANYYATLPDAMRALRAVLDGHAFDLVASPPSRRHDAAPYLASIKMRNHNATDLSSSFHRVKDVRAGLVANPLAVIPSIALTYGESLKGFRNVLIVDDVYASGATSAAMVFRMEERGLPVDALVSIAAPLLAAA